MNKIIIDLDGTLTEADTNDYKNVKPKLKVIKKLQEYKELGFSIVIMTARNMRTYEGNVGKINIHTLPIIIDWLNKHNVPFDEIIVGKPWCGNEGFYVDDRAVRPDEFSRMSMDELNTLFIKDK
ncbi:HAD-IIIC family phosphatase [Citrobacter amalonaticus]|uniref:HAD-IIIC family phosphatase n=1 Tax=Citrobacter amalonaticus TaxID=35703 RepID=UPI00076B4968|nr:HAD-IIIC family phosphatase [Citrobacter amalonaticus]AMG56006.1 capsular biosynthesis protein [Citrobacter amalonaticus]MCX3393963.1 HAD-IIIC family phosphatase [Citrobacter amalonaticus]MDQ2173483.1 HAD-IIIC family phosphatase [Citrobacter amalonaticus]MDR1845889.1 HAD-IIIC family phosphatase [Citrobacter amalonaticus]UBI22491.1 HAD-IIIC family phosphatase [Citrobacter amalonaticus]